MFIILHIKIVRCRYCWTLCNVTLRVAFCDTLIILLGIFHDCKLAFVEPIMTNVIFANNILVIWFMQSKWENVDNFVDFHKSELDLILKSKLNRCLNIRAYCGFENIECWECSLLKHKFVIVMFHIFVQF